MSFTHNYWQALAAAAGAVLLAGGAAVWRFLHRPGDPTEIERKRRSYLNQVGRIVEGRVLDMIEQPSADADATRWKILGRRNEAAAHDTNGTHKLICYSYSISGVTYETAQDVTGLDERIGWGRVLVGQAASVKYDPANPSNSMLIAEEWSGLH